MKFTPTPHPPKLIKPRAPKNRTITLHSKEKDAYSRQLTRITEPATVRTLENKIINQDVFEILDFLPHHFVDLLILDPPYNLNKTFNSTTFRKRSIAAYSQWLESLLLKLLPALKNSASVYVCSEWYSSTAVHLVLEKHLKVRNRITWEREKGRGAKNNWKNASEDIWFATVSDDYTFNVDDVKLKRRVIAPYTDSGGRPKDWHDSSQGRSRLTHPSNLWNDITVPFWSMPENTDHPAQKPEKLLAKLILAGTNENDLVFDPFMGVGSAVVTARKLDRKFLGVEIDRQYCLLAAKRLHLAESDKNIQGYSNGVFYERNTPNSQKNSRKTTIPLTPGSTAPPLLDSGRFWSNARPFFVGPWTLTVTKYQHYRRPAAAVENARIWQVILDTGREGAVQ
ncbi:MAG: DNA-methyltransferase [Planctomycetota bacterium]|jgi:site-specific DNA-methyltransferase (adenine-specific)